MAQKPKKSAHEPKVKIAHLELDSDAWPKFERMIRAVAKAGPQHKTARPDQSKKKRKAAK